MDPKKQHTEDEVGELGSLDVSGVDQSLMSTSDSPVGSTDGNATEMFVDTGEGSHSQRDLRGSVIGRYTLLERLGEGGFGTVWRAEQREPVKREVALKILKLGMDSQEILARFAQERQALAVMDHPGIAKVLDAGITDTGRSYFVMELVRGKPLHEYCNSNKLATQARLQLFMQVCAAVQHAHQKGIIHRDLKPSNIIVAEGDAGPQPKVIDFGIAKATSTAVAEVSMQTQVGKFMGTPAYMSPEQAEGLVDDIDTRSDVYSLGVILYQLLTNSLPFEPGLLRQVGHDEFRRRIRLQPPERPSTRMAKLTPEQQKLVADTLGVDRTRLIGTVRGDLDWIIMKSLEKDRARRYDTAQDFAADIRRFLSSEPVVARPPSTGYVLRRFVARNRTAVVVAALVFVSLLGALGMTGYSLYEANVARAKADREAKNSNEAFKILSTMIRGAGPSIAQGKDTTLLRELLDKTASNIEENKDASPEVEYRIRKLLGDAYYDVSDFPKSLAMSERCVAIAREIFQNDPKNLSGALSQFAIAMDGDDNLDKATGILKESIAIQETIKPRPARNIARDQDLIGWYYVRMGRFDEAEKAVRQALEYFVVPDRVETEEEREAVADRAAALGGLGLVLLKTGRFQESEEVHREAAQLARLSNGELDPLVVTCDNNLGHLLVEVGKVDEAEQIARKALADEEKLNGKPVGSCTDALYKILASACLGRGDYDGAIAHLRKAIEVASEVYGPQHRYTNDKRALLVNTLLADDRLDEAVATLDESKVDGELGETADTSLVLANARVALVQKDYDQARRLATEDFEKVKQGSVEPTIRQVDAMLVLAKIDLAQGRKNHAREILDSALMMMKPELNPTVPAVLEIKEMMELCKKPNAESLDNPR